MLDLGISAFHGDNALVGNLGVFLQAVRDKKVCPGSALIVESVDRISRQGIDEGYDLCKKILKSGIHIITLSPERDFGPEAVKGLTKGALELQLILERAAEESEMKSDRLGAVWGEKKSAARQDRSVQTSRLPSWIEVVGRKRVGKHMVGGVLRIIPERAVIIRRIFGLACHGYGLALIVKQLTSEGVPPIGGKRKRRKDDVEYIPEWSKAYVHKILTERVVLGEYQPKKNGKPEGPPVEGFYPVVPGIDEALWNKAQGALASRKGRAGRVSTKTVSLFSGLVVDAMTQKKLLFAWQTRGCGKNRQKARVLVSADSMEGRARSTSFPAVVFEDAVLSLLKEVKSADVVGEVPEQVSVGLTAELAGVESRMKAIEAELSGDGGDVPTLVRVLKGLEARAADLRDRRDATRQKVASPPGIALDEAQTLIDVARDGSLKLRLRGLLRQSIEGIRVVIVVRRSIRLCAAQIRFPSNKVRDYLIVYKPAGNGRQGGWWARSLAAAAGPGDMDLRDCSHAARLATALEQIDLDAIVGETPEE